MAISRFDSRRHPGRPKADGTNRRELILQAALKEFARSGYEGTSLTKIAAGADITKAALLHYFDSKESLFAEVLALRDLEVQKTVLKFSDEEKLTLAYMMRKDSTFGWSFSGDIWQYAELLIKLLCINEKYDDYVKLYITVSSFVTEPKGEGFHWIHDHLMHLIRLIAEGFEYSKKIGTVAEELDSYQVARTIVAIMDGMQLQWIAARNDSHAHRDTHWAPEGLHQELSNYIDLLRHRYQRFPQTNKK